MENEEKRTPDALLAQITEFISARMGLHFPEGRRRDLERGLRLASQELGFHDPEACARWLLSAPIEKEWIEVLAGHLTVGETYFFRDRRCFEFLEEKGFPELIAKRRNAGKYLRIWSAGCCTGEEPFSVALLLDRLLPDIREWKITILGTDINPAFLRKASAGIYGDWSFRDAPPWIRQKYFTPVSGNRSEILSELRKRVHFQYHNLAEDDFPSPEHGTDSMDLILCRNVLMYSSSKHQERVVQRFRKCLVEGGWLMVSPSEAYDPLFSGFSAVRFRGAACYRKARATGCSAAEEARRQVPGSPVARLEARISLARSSLKEFEGATASPSPGPAQEPKTAKSRDPYEESLSLYAQGRHREALERLKEIPPGASREAGAAALGARILADLGNLSEAVEYCRRAVAAERCNPAHYYLLATILEEQGRLQDAGAELRNTLYLDQHFVPAHLLLGNLALRQGNREESARHFQNALKLLSARPPEEPVPDAGGLTAGRLMEMIQSMS